MNLLSLQKDPAKFRTALQIDTDAGPQPLAQVIDPWQATDFAALDSGWQRAAVGKSHPAQYQRAWLERARGHSKSADLAVMAGWALFASRRQLSGIAAAGDQDQARLLRDALGRLVYCNPWLGKLLEVQNYRVVNTRTSSTLDIISSDAKTSYGLTPDFVIADEVTHWKSRDLWDSLISSAAKRATCMFVVITNAGLQDDWQWNAREAVRTDPKWYFSRLDGAVASWITPDRLQEQQRLLPTIAYRRLWLNEWTTGGGDALSQEDINIAFHANLTPHGYALPTYEYCGGLDLGVSRDASAVVILGVRRGGPDHGRIRLAYTRLWRPTKGSKVSLQEIEDCLIALHARYRLRSLNYDPWEARHMAQRLSATGLTVADNVRRHPLSQRVPMTEVTQTPANLQRIATVLIEAFNDHRIELYEDPDLRRDLTRLRVEERQYGFRLTAPRDEYGHGDMGTAFSLAMLAASEVAGKPRVVVGTIQAGGERSAVQRTMQRLERERQEYQQLARLPSDDTRQQWTSFMRSCGRAL